MLPPTPSLRCKEPNPQFAIFQNQGTGAKATSVKPTQWNRVLLEKPMVAPHLRIRRLLRDLIAQQGVHKSSRLENFLSQVSPAYSPTPNFFMVYLNTHYTPWPRPSGLFPSGLFIKFYVLYAMPTSWFHNLKRIWWRVKVMNLNTMQFCQEFSYFLSVRYKYCRQCWVYVLPLLWQTRKITGRTAVLCVLIYVSGWQRRRKIWP
jgi:hypothetical protein